MAYLELFEPYQLSKSKIFTIFQNTGDVIGIVNLTQPHYLKKESQLRIAQITLILVLSWYLTTVRWYGPLG